MKLQVKRCLDYSWSLQLMHKVSLLVSATGCKFSKPLMLGLANQYVAIMAQ